MPLREVVISDIESGEDSPIHGIHISAPAKVNVILKVRNQREDGYHNLWSLMHTVALVDELRFQVRPHSTQIQLRCDNPTVPTDSTNLVVRAAALMLERSAKSVGLAIELRKGIPIGAGLGGGSSDAAATLIALNHLLKLEWTIQEMTPLAMSLGSDVPFFLSAPCAVVEGRGEQVTPFHVKGQRWVLLIKPEFSIETKWAYGQLVHHRTTYLRDQGEGTVLPPTALRWEELIPHVENDFEEALEPIFPVLHDIKSQLVSLGAEVALLSGSGSTVFAIFQHQEEALRAKSNLGLEEGWWAAIAETCSTPLISHEYSSAVPPLL